MIIRNSHKDFFGTDIHPAAACGRIIGMRRSRFFRLLVTSPSFIGGNGPGSKDKQTPNRDQKASTAFVITNLYATPDPSLSTDFRSTIGDFGP